MLDDLKYLDGRKFCVVFVKVTDDATGKVELQALHGRASIDASKLRCITPDGAVFTVPHSALPNILPSDGTELLKDADYFVLVKTDQNIQFIRSS